MKKALLVGGATLLTAVPAFAQAAATSAISNNAYYALGAGIAIGLAAFGGGLGQGRIGGSAMDGIARNPQAAGTMLAPLLIGLAFVESLVIYALVIAFMLQGKIH